MTKPPQYCPHYEKARNQLIPLAAKTADTVAGVRRSRMTEKQLEAWYAAWNLCFHETMNMLAKRSGLT